MTRFIRRSARILAVSTVGTVLLVLGVIMLVTPGPGLLMIGLSVLVFSLEFAWAGRLRDRARGWLGDTLPARHHPWLRRLGLLDPEPPDHGHGPDGRRGPDPHPRGGGAGRDRRDGPDARAA